MKSVVFLVIVVAAATSAFEQCGQKGSGSRIVHGMNAAHGEFPWQISLQFQNRGHICGGTILNKEWILTAAHCVDSSQNPDDFKVRTGEWHLKSIDGTEKDFDVEKVIIHEKWGVPKELHNDIALLKLKTSIDLSGPYAGPACLPPIGKDYRGTSHCVLSGWGLIQRFPAILANTLQKTTGEKYGGKIWFQGELERFYFSLPPKTLGYGDTWVTACMGDSGGPLVCPEANGEYNVVGVVSFGSGSCEDKPAVFTEVSAYRDWIYLKTKDHSDIGI